MTASLSTVLSQLLPTLTVMLSAPPANQSARAMTPSLDSLLNQSVPLKVVGSASNGAKPALIQAIVLSSTALTSPTRDGNYNVLLSDGKQQFEIISKAPLQVGSQLQLKLTENNQSAVLLKILNANASISTPTNGSTSVLKQTNTNTAASAPQTNIPPFMPQSTNATIIEQAVRQALPQQQPLHQLVPLLQYILQQSNDHWPKALTQTMQHLLQQFPTAEKMQQAKPVKQALENSGIFLESKLARLALTQPVSSNDKLTRNPPLQHDIKAVLQHLSQLVEKSSITKSAPQSHIDNTDLESATQTIPAYTGKPTTATASSPGNKHDQNLDVMLRQLSRQLLASIARTQFNQLESLGSRQSNNPDNQGPANSWVTEIPILQGKQVDNLVLRIDQQTLEQTEKKEQQQQKLWTVMLAFDLHMLGKMSVQLKILNRNVSATVWSSLQQTHTQVKQHINELTTGLEKIGVSVTNIDCQQGLPPKNQSPLLRQLVDIRT